METFFEYSTICYCRISLAGDPSEHFSIPLWLTAKEANELAGRFLQAGESANYYDQEPLCSKRDKILRKCDEYWPHKKPFGQITAVPEDSFLSRAFPEYAEKMRVKKELEEAAEREEKKKQKVLAAQAAARRKAERAAEYEPSEGDGEEDILAKSIMRSMLLGNYEVSVEGPECVEEMHHPDGSAFYVVHSMDDVRTSTDAGSCSVSVEGEEFICNLNTGEWEYSGEYDLLGYPDLVDILEGSDGVLSGVNLDTDSLIAVYEAANQCECDEYYFEECDPPMDVDDMTRLADCDLDKCGDYYLLEEIQDADEDHDSMRWARAALDEPDYEGQYRCVVLLFDEAGEQVGQMDCDNVYDADDEEFR